MGRTHGDGHRGAVDLVGLGALISRSSIGYLTLSTDGVVLSHNDAVLHLSASGRLVDRRMVELLVPADRTRASRVLAEVVAGGGTAQDVPLRLRRGGSPAARVLVSAALVDRPDGQPSHLAVLVQDDTARHAAGEEMSRLMSRATALLRALPDAVLICAGDGTITEVNDQAEHLFGYSAEELVGQPIELLVPAQHVAAHRWQRGRFTASSHARPMLTGPGGRGGDEGRAPRPGGGEPRLRHARVGARRRRVGP